MLVMLNSICAGYFQKMENPAVSFDQQSKVSLNESNTEGASVRSDPV